MVFKKVDHGVRVDSFDAFFPYINRKKQILLSRKDMYFMTICVYQHFRVVQSAKNVCSLDKGQMDFFAMYRILMVKKHLYFQLTVLLT